MKFDNSPVITSHNSSQKAAQNLKKEAKIMAKKRIVFMGTPEYAVEILDAIIGANYELPLVLTQPDKPVGRKATLTPPAVKKYLLERSVKTEILQPDSLKNSQICQRIKEAKPDFIIVAAYGQILPKEILQIAPCINLHASILPKFRGASPIQSAILSGDELSGITAILMGEGLDDGDMLAFYFTGIEDRCADELFELFGKMAARLTLDVVENFAKLAPMRQVHANATRCKKIQKQDGKVDFSDDVGEVLRKFRAFNPWPGVFLESGLKLLEIKPYQSAKFEPNKIAKISKSSFVMGFNGGAIEIHKLQEAGKKPLSGAEFINGKRLKVGDQIS